MNRYGCFSITGYGIQREGKRVSASGKRRASIPRLNEAVTTWYVFDAHDCGEIVAEYEHEHEAKLDVFRSNADERRWEKRQLVGSNGRV